MYASTTSAESLQGSCISSLFPFLFPEDSQMGFLRRFVRTAHQHPSPLKQIHLRNFDVFSPCFFFSPFPPFKWPHSRYSPSHLDPAIFFKTLRPKKKNSRNVRNTWRFIILEKTNLDPSGLSWCQSFHSWKANARDMPPKSPIKLPKKPPPNNQPHISTVVEWLSGSVFW